MTYTYADVLKKHGPLISKFRQKIAVTEKEEQHLYFVKIGVMILEKVEENKLEKDEAEKLYDVITCDAEILIDYLLRPLREGDDLGMYLDDQDYTYMRNFNDQSILDSSLARFE